MSHYDVLDIFSRAGQTTDTDSDIYDDLPFALFGNAMYVWYEISPYLSQFLEGTTTCILVILYSHEWTSQWL